MHNTASLHRKVVAKICWVPAIEGGRQRPPRGPRYSTVARFEKEAEKWPKEAWSIVAEFAEKTDDSSCVVAELRFLSPSAPSRLLDSGSKFELYEGHRLVARGEVLSDCIESAAQMARTHATVEMQEI
jgi:hypothetical protein